MKNLVNLLRSCLRNERGAEMVEWVVVVVILAVIAVTIFGPDGVLFNALNDGINSISNLIDTAASTTPGSN